MKKYLGKYWCRYLFWIVRKNNWRKIEKKARKLQKNRFYLLFKLISWIGCFGIWGKVVGVIFQVWHENQGRCMLFEVYRTLWKVNNFVSRVYKWHEYLLYTWYLWKLCSSYHICPYIIAWKVVILTWHDIIGILKFVRRIGILPR